MEPERTEKTIFNEKERGRGPNHAGEPCLIVLTGNAVGMMYKLTGTEWLIGRTREADICIEDPSISRSHAKLSTVKSGLYLQDLNSTNGTFVNEKKVTGMHQVSDGDKIRLGDTTILKFTYQDELEENFQKHLYDSATKDGLTKIYNRKYFLERIKSELTFANRHRTCLSMVLFDVDHFKKINDTYGHPVGDFVLRSISDLVRRIIRIEDVFSRYGGEEFTLLLRGINEKQAFIFSDRMRRTIENHVFQWQATVFSVTISVGIATLNKQRFETCEEMIEAADAYLYKAKNGGRNCVMSVLQTEG